MKAQLIADILALKFDKSEDFAFKQALINDIISYRAILINQQIDKTIKVDDGFLVTLKNISIEKIDNCFYSSIEIPDFIAIRNKSFYNVELYDDTKCCINSNIDEVNIVRLPYIKHKTFANSLPFYILDNKKIKLFNINSNIKYIDITFVPSNYYEYAKTQNELNSDKQIPCYDIGDVNIEETFRDAIEMFILKTYNAYKGTKDGDIHLAPDKE